ncbi:hypothetical protein GCM10027168_61200 [Streptomyces capparidis]
MAGMSTSRANTAISAVSAERREPRGVRRYGRCADMVRLLWGKGAVPAGLVWPCQIEGKGGGAAMKESFVDAVGPDHCGKAPGCGFGVC